MENRQLVSGFAYLVLVVYPIMTKNRKAPNSAVTKQNSMRKEATLFRVSSGVCLILKIMEAWKEAEEETAGKEGNSVKVRGEGKREAAEKAKRKGSRKSSIQTQWSMLKKWRTAWLAWQASSSCLSCLIEQKSSDQ